MAARHWPLAVLLGVAVLSACARAELEPLAPVKKVQVRLGRHPVRARCGLASHAAAPPPATAAADRSPLRRLPSPPQVIDKLPPFACPIGFELCPPPPPPPCNAAASAGCPPLPPPPPPLCVPEGLPCPRPGPPPFEPPPFHPHHHKHRRHHFECPTGYQLCPLSPCHNVRHSKHGCPLLPPLCAREHVPCPPPPPPFGPPHGHHKHGHSHHSKHHRRCWKKTWGRLSHKWHKAQHKLAKWLDEDDWEDAAAVASVALGAAALAALAAYAAFRWCVLPWGRAAGALRARCLPACLPAGRPAGPRLTAIGVRESSLPCCSAPLCTAATA